MPFLQSKIISYNCSVYGEANDPVTVVSVSGHVAIVEAANKNRFPVLVELLGEDMVVIKVAEPIRPVDLFNQPI